MLKTSEDFLKICVLIKKRVFFILFISTNLGINGSMADGGLMTVLSSQKEEACAEQRNCYRNLTASFLVN